MLCASVQAQIFRAYLASDGSDANPCTRAQPCRLLPAALTAVADGGEIWMLDSANFNTGQVNVTKSVSILAIPGTLGSVVATGSGHGISINAASVKVTLRNLVIVHLTSSQSGISFTQGAELNVAECEIANVQGKGISATSTSGKVTVKNTVLRGAATGFHADGAVVASLDGVHIKDNNYGVFADAGSRVTVSNSVISGNVYGAWADPNGGITRLVVERSVVTGNTYGILATTHAASDVAEVTASHNAVTHNGTGGFFVSAVLASTATLVADGNTVTENQNGFILGSGTSTIYTRGNNTLKFNTVDVLSGSLTALAGQ
jgi:hypothetical protein